MINDRFAQHKEPTQQLGDTESLPAGPHYDFRTPEYTSYSTIQPNKWEACRGVGSSFGYNQIEGDAHHIEINTLIRLFVDIVAKNGNLLLNVGPMPDGSIPDLQLQRLAALGAWIETNGEAIFGSRPWNRAEATTVEGIDVRFTQKDDTLYAFLMDTPTAPTITINDLHVAPDATIRLLGSDADIAWEQVGDGIRLTLPQTLTQAPVHVLSMTPLTGIS